MKGWNDSEQVLSTAQRRNRRPVASFLAGSLVGILITSGLLSTFPSLSGRLVPSAISQYGIRYSYPASATFEWSDIEATEQLEFHPCYSGYGGFECAKLKLPLDYFNETYPNETISLALVKLPAKVPVTDPRYGGPILINPGGPGGSGILLALGGAYQLQTIVDPIEGPNETPLGAKYFDIIGFDPRGIGLTEPAAVCLPDGPSIWSWMLREKSEGILGSSDAALGRLWSMTHAFGSSCKQVAEDEDGPDIKQYMTTASVARDMLELAEKHAAYVEDQSASKKPAHGNLHCNRRPEPVKLQYWGFSYGTYLGSTFASMFPDRVGRLILDGVVNSDDYNQSLGNGSLHDAEKVMNSFYTYCINVGPKSCPLATHTSTATDVKERTQSIISSLYHNPLPIVTATGPEVFSYSDIKSLAFSSLYLPAIIFPLLAQVLVAVEAGSGSALNLLVEAFRPSHVYQCPLNSSTPAVQVLTDTPGIAILCSDGYDQSSENTDSFKKYWHELAHTSPTSGSIWAMLRMKCAAWKIRAVYRFKGEFGGKTSHPILWIGNTADPVTPLKSARIMGERFVGSVVLTQDSAGHCSISTPTPCTLNHIRNYFQFGTLPPQNTICIPPTSPFSLNSTRPRSPFYDVELTKIILGVDDLPPAGFATPGADAFVEEQVDVLELANRVHTDEVLAKDIEARMEAAKHVQRFFAEENVQWKFLRSQRADELLSAFIHDDI